MSYEHKNLNGFSLTVMSLVSAALTNFACILALLFWKPRQDQLYLFFIFPALWGMADAIWQTQTNGEKIINSFALPNKTTCA